MAVRFESASKKSRVLEGATDNAPFRLGRVGPANVCRPFGRLVRCRIVVPGARTRHGNRNVAQQGGGPRQSPHRAAVNQRGMSRSEVEVDPTPRANHHPFAVRREVWERAQSAHTCM